ncbi:porin [Chromobacterium amazonense]|uniref:Porin n=1 Tax=Chromobacterium amazonense TaxID=1382803 RepID=A0A2S9X2X0_9NEIS|nr:porin [Chromobacterium amazonense]PRP70025.1 porin [Chromobacterium amazonense]
MKKSLIALLVASMPAAAFADVTIYGAIKGGVEYVDNGSVKKTNIDDLGSRIGFKGAEDLGNGLKAIWQVETGFNIDGTTGSGSHSGTFANRNSFLGLQSSLGTLRFGNVSNYLDSDMGVVDTWSYNNAALGLGIFTRDGDRLKNSVRYDLPTLVPGLTAAFQYGTKEDKTAATGDRETSIVGLGYENSGFFGKYAYIHQSKATTAASYKANDKHQLEVGYNANNLFVGFGYKQSKGGADVVGSDWASLVAASIKAPKTTDDVKAVEYALTAGYTFGAITPKFSYVHGDNVKVNGVSQDNTKYDQYVLGADYALSKRTTVGAQYGQIAVKGNGNKDLKTFGLNMVHNF